MTKLIIDGKEIDVPPEYTLLQACEMAGAEIARHRELAVLPARPDRVSDGERVTHSCFVLEGMVGTFGQTRNGARQITSVFIAGDMIDLQAVVLPEALSALQALFDRIISDLRLQPVADAVWHQFPDAGGLTGVVVLSESHLTCHTFPEHGSLCLNLFCCRPRPAWDWEGELRTLLGATDVTVRSVERPYAAAPALLG